MKTSTLVGFLGVVFVGVLIAIISLTLLIRRVREARRATMKGDGVSVA